MNTGERPPRVVALVPTWRSSAYIRETLETLVSQTWPNLEVLISDDASPDDTASICEQFAARDPRFRVIRQPRNLGWTGNVNALLRVAQGDYFLFAFQDDLLAPTYIERCVEALEANPRAVIAYSDIALVNQDGSREERGYPELHGVTDRVTRARWIAHAKVAWWIPNRGVFRAWAAERIGGLRRHSAGEFSADWPWLMHMSLLGEFVRVPERLVTKIYMPNSLSRTWSYGLRSWIPLTLDAMGMVSRSVIPLAEKLRLYGALTRVVRNLAWRSMRFGSRGGPAAWGSGAAHRVTRLSEEDEMKRLDLAAPIFLASVLLTPSPHVAWSQTSNPAYTIEAIRYASVPQFPLSALVMGARDDQKIDIAMVVWLIRGGGHTILFDSGFHMQKYIASFHVTDFISPDKAVRLAGVAPAAVTDIVISHAHWDHMGGIHLFPKATIWIQRAEYEYYTGAAWQTGGQHGGIEPEDVKELVRRNIAGQVRLVDGDAQEILPGIRVYTGARHTYASQYVGIEGQPTYVLASDNCYLYENLRSHRASATFEPADSAANLAAQRRMVELAGSVDRVVPGHDVAQFERFNASGRVAKIR